MTAVEVSFVVLDHLENEKFCCFHINLVFMRNDRELVPSEKLRCRSWLEQILACCTRGMAEEHCLAFFLISISELVCW